MPLPTRLPSPTCRLLGDITIAARGAFLMRGVSPRINASGEGGGGVVDIRAARVELRSGVVTVRGGVGEDCDYGGDIRIRTDGPLLSNAMLRANASSPFCGGGYVALQGGAYRCRVRSTHVARCRSSSPVSMSRPER
jgi:hypothetical protein